MMIPKVEGHGVKIFVDFGSLFENFYYVLIPDNRYYNDLAFRVSGILNPI